MTSNIDREVPVDALGNLDTVSRFWPKADMSGGPESCWRWTAKLDQAGYGRFNLGGRMALAHRVAWVLSGRELHPGMVLDHTCENPACVNPRHLEEVSQTENLKSRSLNMNNKSGVRGVWWDKRERRWKAAAQCAGERQSLGYHDSLEDAARAVAMWWWARYPETRNVGIEDLSDADKALAEQRWGVAS